MNYLELINKCLIELNYKQVYSFVELTKNDHSKLKNILNLINSEVCSMGNWEFLLNRASLELPKGVTEIENTIVGKITKLIIDGVAFEYCNDFEKYYQKKLFPASYSIFNGKILLNGFDEDKTIDIVYETSNYAVNGEGEAIDSMSEGEDSSIIPMPYVEPLLVYGACMRLKANPESVKFNYWYSMYKDALANLRLKISPVLDNSPIVKMHRR